MRRTARAVGIPHPGGPEVLRVIEREVRAPGPGELRIEVNAAAVNPTDIGLRRAGGGELQPPWIPGMDAAGTVESVGEGVERLRVGEEVMAAVMPRRPEGGAQAELIVVPAASVVPLPDDATPAQASTLPMNGLTARLGLELLELSAGQTLAVSGGAGLLASYAIQLARDQGLTVLADANPDDAELVRSFGADVVVPRGDRFNEVVRSAVPDGVDGLFDTASLGRAAFDSIRDGGGIAVVHEWRGEDVEDRGIHVHHVEILTVLDRTDWLEQLRRLASAGTLKLRVAGEYPPEEAGKAERAMDAGGLRGRVVIVF
jgi:NADPH:quinone reductase